MHRLLSCESRIFDETGVGCGGKPEADLRQKECLPEPVGELPPWGTRSIQTCPRPGSPSCGILTLDDKALFVNMLLICNFENKIETSCILKYKMKCDALYTI